MLSACRTAGDRHRGRPDARTRRCARPCARRARPSCPRATSSAMLHLAAQGVTRDPLPGVRHRLGQRGLLHRLRPELQQQRARAQRLLRRARATTASGSSSAAPTARARATVPAEQLWDEIAHAAWACADPGVQYDTTINEWHTCPEDGRINASNPCVTGDTLVATADGWQRIDALVGKTARVIGADGAAPSGDPHLPDRPQAGVRSPDAPRLPGAHHRRPRVLTVGRGDVAVADLTAGDRLMLQGPGFGRRTPRRRPGARESAWRWRDGCLTQSVVQRPRAGVARPHHRRRRGSGAGRGRRGGQRRPRRAPGGGRLGRQAAAASSRGAQPPRASC